MRIVAISDTHERHEKVGIPEGDVLIHAGDLTWIGDMAALQHVAEWIERQPFRHRVCIAGNHDRCFERTYERDLARRIFRDHNITYLEDEAVTLGGVKFYGSPWQPKFYDWAFNLPRGGEKLKIRWAGIPDDTNVLITHGPPKGIGDLVPRGERTGCEHLLARVLRLEHLKAHIFGHIHEGYGIYGHPARPEVQFVNASICTGAYLPTNPPIVVNV
jgi:Icc-related predicted phosphoesterase